MSFRIWAVRAGGDSEADPLFIENGQIAVSFRDANEDLSALPAQRAAFKDVFARAEGEAKPGAIPVQAGQLFRFVHEMKVGDRVIYPRKIDRTLMWGEISTPYMYDRSGNPDFPHRRGVRWLASLSRDVFSQGALYELGSVLTLFEVRNFASEFTRRFEPPSGAGPASSASLTEDETQIRVARDIAETTKDFISKKIKTDLKGFPLEPFVADLFRAMGYNAHATRAVRDEGIDVVAHRDELGIEPPILKIQVKAHDGNIGPDLVKAFYAMIHDRDVGIFIATGGYTAAAQDFARTKGNLKLVDGVEFVSLIEKYYDGLDLKSRKQIPLRRMLVPDVLPDE
ncbi:restriction endonuclease [Rhodoblastus acidophilus]|uniref:Restriction endonuclease n=1 Tax=Candidatus Rhodoblastus alkanivorans TaxID=2954117 RepID=A0ABS9Z280_9HYPH|nr:restriction endonuclease [Candidatus Rhodoblastus alkanivorans]MCI4678146.1 restriction endonuclease [Candidatus Rhodoblastus alkanivorans]MCI4681196.1 restriction endonuclease [Candidatus Rhodoblastus alkanivorans]MDI4642239.1 restriction endonuclease [Rhodoblastus acidophilus]